MELVSFLGSFNRPKWCFFQCFVEQNAQYQAARFADDNFSQSKLESIIFFRWTNTSFKTSSSISIAPHGFPDSEETQCIIWSIGGHGDSFKKDGTPSHFAILVNQYSGQMLGSPWIGRGCSVLCPPQSRDFTPCDFFLSGWTMDRVFSNLFSTISELKKCIRAAITLVNGETLPNFCWNYRLPYEAAPTPKWRPFWEPFTVRKRYFHHLQNKQ